MAESKMTFRLAVEGDAPAFADWVAQNPQVDQKDLMAGTKKNNPTVLTFVVESDGKPILFAPLYLAAILAHLGFNPEARASEKMRALQVLTDGVMAFMLQFGIREILALTKPDYGVAQWGLKHGFDLESRSLLKMDMNPILEIGRLQTEAAARAAVVN